MLIVMYASLQEFEKVLKQKQVELELLEVKLTQKSVTVAQERENNIAEQLCVSVSTPCQTVGHNYCVLLMYRVISWKLLIYVYTQESGICRSIETKSSALTEMTH